jgi:GTP cyclohydrolase I
MFFYILLLSLAFQSVSCIRIEKAVSVIIKEVGENSTREGLANTPARFSKSIRFLTSGYQKTAKDVVGNGLFCETDGQIENNTIIIRDIEMYSLCEHHLLPFFGKVHIAYIPNGKILGLSKFARIVDLFSRRFQVQERLTREIAESIMEVTCAKGVVVVIEAQHFCMMMRGVQKQNSKTVTRFTLGNYQNCDI